MKLIGNELKYAQDHIKNNKIDKKNNGRTLVVLAKYYYHHENKTHEEIKHLLIEFLSKVEHSFDIEYLDKLIVKNANNETKLYNVEEVVVTKSEMEMIEKEENEIQRRLLFVMLVMYKVKNAIYKNDNCKIGESRTEIFSDARSRRNSNDRQNLIGGLCKKGYITIPNDVREKRIILNYVDYDSEPAIVVNRFDDYILDYHKYKGKRVIECQCCGKRVFSKSKTKPEKYCKECKHKIDIEKYEKYNKKRQGK